MVREPLGWQIDVGHRTHATELVPVLRRAVLGPIDDDWQPASWLKPHQVEAARRVRSCLTTFGGALLADAVGLGKTYVALSVASNYLAPTALVPAPLVSQWRRTAGRVSCKLRLITHESLSRGSHPPPSDLLIVDEAHRFRNNGTRRYDQLARSVRTANVLLLSATPVVNRAQDLVALLRLFAADNMFAPFGVGSLEGSLETRDFDSLAWATAPAVVSRSAATIDGLMDLLPTVRNRPLLRPAPVALRDLESILAAMDSLSFPSVGGEACSALMKLHLLFRLASSRSACRETIRKHLVYTERALQSAAAGKPLSRHRARQIFSGDDEFQLELGDMTEPGVVRPGTTVVLQRDRQRLTELLGMLPSDNCVGPKPATLIRILKRRAARRTIVFTTAVATALELARALQWRRVAVVGAGKAWIASGRLAVEEALALFAPRAQRANDPHRSRCVNVLLATDLASEGLDLQDADGVVHYDLPWTPLRLEQRVGRIARLGSLHSTAEVSWFAPARAIEERLHLIPRISDKVTCQLQLGVAVTSEVGRAQRINKQLSDREKVGHGASSSSPPGRGYAVVRGPLVAAITLHWKLGDSRIPELVVIRGQPPHQEHDYAAIESTLDQLVTADSVMTAPARSLIACLRKIIRERLAALYCGPSDKASCWLARVIVRQAGRAAAVRDLGTISILNTALDRIACGMTVGAQRILRDVLLRDQSYKALKRWADELRDGEPTPEIWPEVVAALFGDGTTDRID